MTPQIKQRIEQIRRGEVPDGYKRTKVGLVPEEWKIKRLAQVLRKQTCKNTDNAIHNVLTNSATRGIVDQKDYFDKQIANSENTDNYYIVENGYFVYNPRISVSAPCGPFNKYYGCEKGIMSPLYTVYKYIDCSTDYTEYLSYFFSSANWHRYMNSIANYGARNDRMNVTSDTMSAMPLPYPPLPEQKKIAEILQTQDKLIELQQKKIEELKKLKKAYLSKMLPKKGCNVPEIRFPGFTDPWKQRKVQDVADRFDNLRIPVAANLRVHGTTPYYGANGIQDYVEGFTHDGEFVLVAEDGANDLKNYPVKCVNGRIWVNNHAHVLQGKAGISDNSFLAFAISQSDIESLLVGGSRAKLNAETLMSIEFKLPCLQEQYRIGEYLTQLDHLITLHQRKLEEMKKQKKALMQLLLTGIVRVRL